MLTDQSVRYFNDHEEKRSKRVEKELVSIVSSIRRLTEEVAKLNKAIEAHNAWLEETYGSTELITAETLSWNPEKSHD